MAPPVFLARLKHSNNLDQGAEITVLSHQEFKARNGERVLCSTLMSSVPIKSELMYWRCKPHVLISFCDRLVRVVWNTESKASSRKSGAFTNTTEDQLRHVDLRRILRENYTPEPFTPKRKRARVPNASFATRSLSSVILDYYLPCAKLSPDSSSIPAGSNILLLPMEENKADVSNPSHIPASGQEDSKSVVLHSSKMVLSVRVSNANFANSSNTILLAE